MRPYIKHLTSTIKGGVDVALTPKTLVAGRNSSGKTAIVATAELCCKAAVTDLAGRSTTSKDADLVDALSTYGDSLYAVATLDDGRTLSWACTRGRRSVFSVPDGIDAARAFPLWGAEAALLGGPDTARRFLVQHAVGKVTEDDILKRIPVALHPQYKQMLMAALPTEAPLDRLLGVMERAKAKIQAERDNVKAATKTAAVTGMVLPPEPTQAQLDEAREAAKAATLVLEEAAAASVRAVQASSDATWLASKKTRVAGIESTIAEIDKRLAAIRSEAAKLRDEVPAERLSTSDDRLDAVVTVMKASLEKNECLSCGRKVDVAALRERIVLVDAAVKNSRELRERWASLSTRWESLRTSEADAVADKNRSVKELADLVQEIADAEAETKSAPEIPDADAIQKARNALQAAQDKLRKLESAKSATATVKRAESDRIAAERSLVEWQQLEEECSKTVESLLDSSVEAFAARVQERLPKTDKFAIQLRAGTRACVRVGLVRDGRIQTALSGAEWARVMSALADVCAPEGDALSVVVPPDKSFDPETLTDVLEAFKRCDSQVIIASAIRPTRVPDGWSVIDVDTMSKPAVTAAPKPKKTRRKGATA